MNIRDVTEADLPHVAEIYAHEVLHGTGTFEYEPPPVEEMAARWRAVTGWGLPYLCAEVEGRFAGYAAASLFRPRTGYRYTVEDSVYVADWARGRGVGKALLQAVIARCEAMGLRRIAAAIGDSANTRSVALHRACGFEDVGVLRAVGWKHGRWLDVVLMQRALGAGDRGEPDGPGLLITETWGR